MMKIYDEFENQLIMKNKKKLKAILLPSELKETCPLKNMCQFL